MKIMVTGGAGFIGANLIERLVKEGHEVVSLDNYDSGLEENHIEGVKYENGDIEMIEYIKGESFDLCFHLAALSRIQPSFENPTETFRVNVRGTEAVMEWARHNNVKVVYAGSSSKHHDPADSPYAMYKFLGEQVCKLYKKSFNVNVEIARFYNVYGPFQISKGQMSTVIGIFEDHFKRKKPLPVVRPGSQTRRFTHIDDTISICILAWQKNLCRHYSIAHKKSYSVIEVAKMFKTKVKFLPKRAGERYASALANKNLSNKIYKYFGKIDLKDYVDAFIKKSN